MVEPRKILVIQLRRIGDVLLTTAAAAALKKRYPRAAVDFLVEPPGDQILAGNPHISEVISYRASGPAGALRWIARIRARRYDWVVDFMGNPRSAILTAASGAPLRAGPAHVAHRWAYNHPLVQSSSVYYAAREKVRVLRTLGVDAGSPAMPEIYFDGISSRPENRVGLVPASRRATRRWPARSYARLGRMLRDRFECAVTVFWGPGEKELAAEVVEGIGESASLCPETPDLRSLAAQICRCRLVVTNCNGPKHLAVALGIPTVTIHGSSDPRSWNPPEPRHEAVREERLFCIGCGLNECPYQLECMTHLTPERVFETASRLFEAESACA